jgi:hypothetical protein
MAHPQGSANPLADGRCRSLTRLEQHLVVVGVKKAVKLAAAGMHALGHFHLLMPFSFMVCEICHDSTRFTGWMVVSSKMPSSFRKSSKDDPICFFFFMRTSNRNAPHFDFIRVLFSLRQIVSCLEP